MLMSRLTKAIPVLAILFPFLSHADETKSRPISGDRVGFYQVNLVCPAAPLIGCGSAAKPLLLELEHRTNVNEAWLNRAGTVIAIVWKENAPRKRAKIVGSILEQ